MASQTAKTILRRTVPHPLYRMIRQRRIGRQVASFPAREVEHRYGARTLRLLLADPLAEGWYDHDWEDLSELRFLRDSGHLAPGKTVFDLGAHHAVVALMAAADVAPGGRVVAVEAEPHNVATAQKNVLLNAELPV